MKNKNKDLMNFITQITVCRIIVAIGVVGSFGLVTLFGSNVFRVSMFALMTIVLYMLSHVFERVIDDSRLELFEQTKYTIPLIGLLAGATSTWHIDGIVVALALILEGAYIYYTAEPKVMGYEDAIIDFETYDDLEDEELYEYVDLEVNSDNEVEEEIEKEDPEEELEPEEETVELEPIEVEPKKLNMSDILGSKYVDSIDKKEQK